MSWVPIVIKGGGVVRGWWGGEISPISFSPPQQPCIGVEWNSISKIRKMATVRPNTPKFFTFLTNLKQQTLQNRNFPSNIIQWAFISPQNLVSFPSLYNLLSSPLTNLKKQNYQNRNFPSIIIKWAFIYPRIWWAFLPFTICWALLSFTI